jgi:hypothetical protein
MERYGNSHADSTDPDVGTLVACMCALARFDRNEDHGTGPGERNQPAHRDDSARGLQR